MSVKKKIVVIYNATSSNDHINREDYNRFYTPLAEKYANNQDIIVEERHLVDTPALLLALQNLLKEEVELYLHFSSHGQAGGIPYGEWLLENKDLGIALDHPKIKFCFFSSCKSADLVKAATEREIPVVIGTKGKNDLSNEHAITFQQLFYDVLIEQKATFHKAFENAYNTLKQKEGLNIKQDSLVVRGGGAVADPNRVELNDLQICFANENDRNACFIYPTIVDYIYALPSVKNIFLFYTDDDDSWKNFSTEFSKSGFAYEVIRISERILSPLDEADYHLLVNNGRPTRLLFHFHSNQQTLLTRFINTIDKKGIYNGEGELKNLKMRIAVNTGVGVTQALNATQHLQKELIQDFLFTVDDISSILTEDTFINFLEEHEIDFSDRKYYTLSFRSDIKSEAEDINDMQKYIRIFLGNHSNKLLINFIINYLRDALSIRTPNLIFDFRHSDSGDLFEEFKNRFKNYPDARLREKINPDKVMKVVFSELMFDDPYTMIFRISDKQQESAIANIEKFLTFFKDITQAIKFSYAENTIPSNPSYIFLVKDDSVNWGNEWQHDIIEFKAFSKPTPVTVDLLQKWLYKDLQKFERKKDKFKLIETIINKIDPTPYTEKCPSQVIAEVCAGFSVPEKQILHLS